MRTSPPRRTLRLRRTGRPDPAPDPEEVVAVTGRVVMTDSDPLVVQVVVTVANQHYSPHCCIAYQVDLICLGAALTLTALWFLRSTFAYTGLSAQLGVDFFTH